jgi:hypothetical protein
MPLKEKRLGLQRQIPIEIIRQCVTDLTSQHVIASILSF